MFRRNIFPSAGRAVVIVAGTAVLAGIVGFSVVMAEGGGSSPGPGASATQSASATQTQFVQDLASQLGIPVATLTDAIRAADTSQLQQLVTSGKITQAQADAITSKIQSADSPPLGVRGHGRVRSFLKNELTDIAQFLDTDTTTIRQALKGGQSLAQVAQAHGKTADQLSTFLTNNLEQRVKDAVASGKLTQAQADTITGNLPARVAKIINATRGPKNSGTSSSTTSTSSGSAS